MDSNCEDKSKSRNPTYKDLYLEEEIYFSEHACEELDQAAFQSEEKGNY
jgi:hypothetical protein